MKKTILAAAITALFATSVNAVEVLNSKGTTVDFSGDVTIEMSKVASIDSEINKDSNFEITVESVVANDLYVHGYSEIAIMDDDDGDVSAGNQYVGFGGDFGVVSVGKQGTIQDDFGTADLSYIGGGNSAKMSNATVGGGDGGHDALIKYNYDADAYSVAASYGMDESETNSSLMELSASTTIDAFDLGAVYSAASDDGTDTDSTTYTIMAGYNMDAYAVVASFSSYESDADSDQVGFAIAASYNWGPGTGYAGFENVDVDGGDSIDYFYVGTDYILTDYATAYVEVSSADEDETYTLGLEVTF
jgi:predicted porin